MSQKPKTQYYSWGRYPQVCGNVYAGLNSSKLDPNQWGNNWIAYGNGRSYGDVCLNDSGLIIPTSKLDKFISFDKQNYLLTVEAGVLFSEILSVMAPQGFFLPVTPGTKFVSVGGAIANDVHGKNHHCAGTFGNHVTRFALLRSDGKIYECSQNENTDLYNATIAGLGLTGIILNATIKMLPIVSSLIDQKTEKFDSLSEFFQISAESESKFNYTVAWIDCLKQGSKLGRGHFISGNHSQDNNILLAGKTPKLNFPFNAPSQLLNKFTVGAFNELYFHRQFNRINQSQVHYEPFFYPLDGVLNWNRMYGKNGFVQFQVVVPRQDASDVISEILKVSSASGLSSFLAVLKEFGHPKSPGLLSFPCPGVTLCLDFPMQTNKTVNLMRTLEQITVSANGRLYPAKDALMSAESFYKMYPRIEEFKSFIDPCCSSSFAKRVQLVS